MNFMVPIKGKVQFAITLDPTVWIFDDRRIDLEQFFHTTYEEVDEDTKYLEGMGKHWSREIMEGSTAPPTLKAEETFSLKKELKDTLGIHFKHFLKNAEPHEDATKIVFEQTTGEEVAIPYDRLNDVILQYSLRGKPLREDGPIHVLFADGSNVKDPIRHVQAIRIE